MTDTWKGGTGDWGTGSNWTEGAPPVSPYAAAATSGTVTVSSSDYESVGGLTFTGAAGLVIDGGSLAVGQGSPPGNPTINFSLGTSGAVVKGSYANLTVGQYVNGSAAGTVHLQGYGTSLYWQASQANSSGMTVDFADGGNSAILNVTAAFNGTVQGFQAGDTIYDYYGSGNATYSFGNNNLTVTRGGRSLTIKFTGGPYNASNVSVDASTGTITTSYAPAAPRVGSATYDVSNGRLVVSRATGPGTAPLTTNASDFDPTKIYLRGQAGTSYVLTGGTVSDVSASAFTVTLTAEDQSQVDGLFNKDGNKAQGNNTYAISGYDGFDTGGRASTVEGAVTVSNALKPTITGASYDASTQVLTVTGTGFTNAGGYAGINLDQFTIRNGSSSYTFDKNEFVGAIGQSQISIDLSKAVDTDQQQTSAGDSSALLALFQQPGPYNLSATKGWDYGAGAAVDLQPITIKGAPPSIVQGSSAPAAGGAVGAGRTVTFTVDFSDAVSVTGTPTLTLTGGRTAAFSSVSGTAVTFSYTVQAGDDVSDLVATAIDTSNGATIASGAKTADLSGFKAIDTGVRLDTTAPAATAVTSMTSTGAASLKAGTTVTFTLAGSEALTVAPGATLKLSNGATAAYAGGSGTGAPTFTYTVADGEDTPDLKVTGYGGSITDAAGNALAAAGVAEDTGLGIDTAPPVATAVTSATSTGAASLKAGTTVTFTLAGSEALTVAPDATLKLSNGATAAYAGGSGTGAPTFTYTVADGEDTPDLKVTGYGGSITDAANNALASAGVAEDTGLGIATAAPTVASPTLTVAQNAGPTSIGIAAPAAPGGSSLTIQAGALPSDGMVALANGTAVATGQALSPGDLAGLTFTPTTGAYGQSSTFTYTATDGAGNSSVGTATLAVGGPGAPSIQVAAGPPTLTTNGTPVSPFATATVSDPNAGATDVVTITLSVKGGTLSDGSGQSGLVRTGPSTYSLAAASPAAATAELEALSFTPPASGSNTQTATTFTLGVASSAGPASPATATASVVNTNRRIGRVVDGYIAGATVFEDDNDNGALDPGEASTTTGADGSYDLPYDLAPLVAIDGVDTSTGLANTATFTAPAGAAVVSPLTTLVGAVAAQNGGDLAAAQAKVRSALGLPSDMDLLSLDPVAAASSGTADGKAAYVATAQVQDAVTLLSAAGSPSGYAAVATAMARASGRVDLSSSAILATIGSGAGLSGPVLDNTVAALQAGNAALAGGAAAATTPAGVLAAVAAAQTAAQGTDAPALAAQAAAQGTALPAPAAAPPGVDVARGAPSIGSSVSYHEGVFALTGILRSASATAVEISAVVDGTATDLGAATLNGDGTFSFDDAIGGGVQEFFAATETDGAAGTATSADPLFSLHGGLSGGRAQQYRYTADGSDIATTAVFKPNSSQAVHLMGPGQTFVSSFFDRFENDGASLSTFVFNPGFGRDVIGMFQAGGTDHDTLSLKGADYGGSVATVLANARDTAAGLLIVDPVPSSPGTGPSHHDRLLLKGVTAVQLAANPGDIAFHA